MCRRILTFGPRGITRNRVVYEALWLVVLLPLVARLIDDRRGSDGCAGPFFSLSSSRSKAYASPFSAASIPMIFSTSANLHCHLALQDLSTIGQRFSNLSTIAGMPTLKPTQAAGKVGETMFPSPSVFSSFPLNNRAFVAFPRYSTASAQSAKGSIFDLSSSISCLLVHPFFLLYRDVPVVPSRRSRILKSYAGICSFFALTCQECR